MGLLWVEIKYNKWAVTLFIKLIPKGHFLGDIIHSYSSSGWKTVTGQIGSLKNLTTAANSILIYLVKHFLSSLEFFGVWGLLFSNLLNIFLKGFDGIIDVSIET